MKKNFTKDGFLISTDKNKLDRKKILAFLRSSYWANNRTKWGVKVTIESCVCFGIYKKGEQIGFARVLTDYLTIAYIADVFILEEYRGKGLSKWLMDVILDYKETEEVKRWFLLTKDAHGLYKQFGFKSPKEPEKYMELIKKSK